MEREVAIRDIINARRSLDFNDDAGDYAAAFFASQALEKALKYVLFEKGHDYPVTHNIPQLLSALDAHSITYPIEIWDVADAVTAWAVRARYSSNRAGARQTIIRVIGYAETLLAYPRTVESSNQFQE